jgi:hypothetical protein
MWTLTLYVAVVFGGLWLTLVTQLEYDTERAGDFEPLIELPLNKKAILGLITTKTGEVISTRSLFYG